MQCRLGESVPAGVDRLLFGKERLGPFDDVTQAVDKALLLRWQNELVVHHDSRDVFWVISIQIELEGHHLVIVRLQLTLHHPVHFIREPDDAKP